MILSSLPSSVEISNCIKMIPKILANHCLTQLQARNLWFSYSICEGRWVYQTDSSASFSITRPSKFSISETRRSDLSSEHFKLSFCSLQYSVSYTRKVWMRVIFSSRYSLGEKGCEIYRRNFEGSEKKSWYFKGSKMFKKMVLQKCLERVQIQNEW